MTNDEKMKLLADGIIMLTRIIKDNLNIEKDENAIIHLVNEIDANITHYYHKDKTQ